MIHYTYMLCYLLAMPMYIYRNYVKYSTYVKRVGAGLLLLALGTDVHSNQLSLNGLLFLLHFYQTLCHNPVGIYIVRALWTCLICLYRPHTHTPWFMEFRLTIFNMRFL